MAVAYLMPLARMKVPSLRAVMVPPGRRISFGWALLSIAQDAVACGVVSDGRRGCKDRAGCSIDEPSPRGGITIVAMVIA